MVRSAWMRVGRSALIFCSLNALSLLACDDGGLPRATPPDASPGTGGSAAGGSGAGAAGAGGGGMRAAEVFEPGRVLEYHLTVADADWTMLEEHGNQEVYVPAMLKVGGGSFGNLDLGQVGLRYKGAWSLHHCWDENGGVRNYAAECAKLSLKISFHEYVPETRLFGLKTLNLQSSAADASKLRELLAYSTFNDFGVDAPRAAPTRVTVNGTFRGLFLAVEAIDGRYTKFHYPDGGDGNLYKEAWPHGGLPDSRFVRALATNDDVSNPDVSDIQGFSRAVAASTEAGFVTDMQPWVDLDRVLRYVAVDRALKNWDGIMTFYSAESSHNFYFYHDDGSERRFHLIPWDLENTLWAHDPYTHPQTGTESVPDWNVLPTSCAPIPVWTTNSDTAVIPPGCDTFLRLLAATRWNRFVEIGEELLSGPLDYDTMAEKVTQWAALIEPVVAEDPFLDLAKWRKDRDALLGILRQSGAEFRAFMSEGYHVQQPEAPLLEPTAEALAQEGPETGLTLDRVQNYEFTGRTSAAAPSGSWTAGGGTTQSISWNSNVPIAGKADLRLDFQFTNTPGAWNEWLSLGLSMGGGAVVDVRGYRQISITMKSDRNRDVRVRVNSPAYDDTYGGAWSEFGMDSTVGTQPTLIKLRLDRLGYPSWAREAWTTGQGWTGPDSEALDTVLSRFSGLIFAPAATTNSSGDMLEPVETGFFEVDNIYFQQ